MSGDGGPAFPMQPLGTDGLRDEASAEIERLRREVVRLWGALLRIRDDAGSLEHAQSIAAFATREGAALKMERDDG